MRGNEFEVLAVTAVGGGVGQSVLRALRLSPLSFQVIGFDMDPWSAGFYTCHRGFLLPAADDPAYFDRLLQVLIRERVKVLIPGSDPELSVLAKMRDKLLTKGILSIVGSAEAVRVCRNKLAAYRFFHDHGLPFVRTTYPNEGLELAEEVGFPLVVKPLSGSASRDVAVIFNEEQLRPYVDRTDLIVQEYLVPQSWGKSRQEVKMDDVTRKSVLRQEDEISIQVLFDHKGNFLGQYTSRNRLEHGVPILIDPCSNGRAEKIAREMALLLVDHGLIGPCNLQCKLTERGPLFFEINPRFTGITAVRAAMGFNEVEAALRRVILGEPVNSVKQSLRVPEDLVCSRYITEMVIPRKELEAIKRDNQVDGHGRGTRL